MPSASSKPDRKPLTIRELGGFWLDTRLVRERLHGGDRWIMRGTAHECSHRKQCLQRVELSGPNAEVVDMGTPARAEAILRVAQEEQSSR
jgi:hypothetical protein